MKVTFVAVPPAMLAEMVLVVFAALVLLMLPDEVMVPLVNKPPLIEMAPLVRTSPPKSTVPARIVRALFVAPKVPDPLKVNVPFVAFIVVSPV